MERAMKEPILAQCHEADTLFFLVSGVLSYIISLLM